MSYAPFSHFHNVSWYSCMLQTPMAVVETPSVTIEQFHWGCRQNQKEKFSVNNLPFPSGPGKAAYHQRWCWQFKNSLYHWAGTTLNLFYANTVMEPKVHEIWSAVYPTLVLADNDPVWNIIHSVVSAHFSFTSWAWKLVLGWGCTPQLAQHGWEGHYQNCCQGNQEEQGYERRNTWGHPILHCGFLIYLW